MRKILVLFCLSLIFASCYKKSAKSKNSSNKERPFVAKILVPTQIKNLGFEEPKINLANFFIKSQVTRKTKTLEDFKGKYLFLTFFATWCPHCQRELPLIDKLADELSKSKSIVFANISVETDGNLQSLIENFKKQFSVSHTPFYYDKTLKSSKNFDVESVPTAFLIDPNGKIVGTFGGEKDWTENLEAFKKYFK